MTAVLKTENHNISKTVWSILIKFYMSDVAKRHSAAVSTTAILIWAGPSLLWSQADQAHFPHRLL